VKKRGSEKASWFVGWLDPDGKRRCKSCGPGAVGKRAAEKEKDRIHSELVTGTYQSAARKTWQDFRREYEEKIAAAMGHRTRRVTLDSLDHFERLSAPQKVGVVKTQTLDDFRLKRSKEKGRRRGDVISPASVNKELRHLRAALAVAVEWGYLAKRPKVRMLKEPKKLPRYVTPEHFAAVYKACDKARLPGRLPVRGGGLVAGFPGLRLHDRVALLGSARPGPRRPRPRRRLRRHPGRGQQGRP
jgi:integrase